MSGPLLEVQDLAVDFLADEGVIQAVRGVSFTIERGQTVALVGESGSGKTVVSQAILGILPQSARVTRGAIILRDPQRGDEALDLAAYPDDHPVRRSIRGDRISIIFQEPMSSLSPLHTIGDQISEALLLHTDADRAEGERRTVEMLAPGRLSQPGPGLPHLPVRAVGRPAPAGDDRHGAGVRSGAADRRRADHRPGRHHPGADPAADAGAPEGVPDGDPVHHPRSRRGRQHGRRRRGAVSRPGDGERQLHRSAEPAAASLSARPAACRAAAAHAGRRAPDAAARGAGQRPRPARLRRPLANAAAGPLLEVQGLRKTYRIRKSGWFGSSAEAVLAVDDVSFTIERGESFGLVGESGCGKTTVSKAIMRAVSTDAGTVVFHADGGPIDVLALKGNALERFRPRLQYMFQDPFHSLNPRMTVYDIVAEPLVIHGIATREGAASSGSRRCSPRSGSTCATCAAIRTASPAASGSGSASPARSRWARRC